MNKLRLKIINIVYFGIIILLIAVGIGYSPIVDECKFYELNSKFYLFRFIPLLVIGLVSYIYTRVKKMRKPSNFYIGFTILIYAFIGMIQKPLERYKMNSRPTIVTKAVVIGKTAGYTGYYAELFYDSKTIKFRSITPIGREGYDKLKIKDTILLKYTIDCKYISSYYKLFPSEKELKKFEEDKYLKDGQILDYF